MDKTRGASGSDTPAPTPRNPDTLLLHELATDLSGRVSASVHVNIRMAVSKQYKQRVHRHPGRRTQISPHSLGKGAREPRAFGWTKKEVQHHASVAPRIRRRMDVRQGNAVDGSYVDPVEERGQISHVRELGGSRCGGSNRRRARAGAREGRHEALADGYADVVLATSQCQNHRHSPYAEHETASHIEPPSRLGNRTPRRL